MHRGRSGCGREAILIIDLNTYIILYLSFFYCATMSSYVRIIYLHSYKPPILFNSPTTVLQLLERVRAHILVQTYQAMTQIRQKSELQFQQVK